MNSTKWHLIIEQDEKERTKREQEEKERTSIDPPLTKWQPTSELLKRSSLSTVMFLLLAFLWSTFSSRPETIQTSDRNMPTIVRTARVSSSSTSLESMPQKKLSQS